MSQHAIAIRCLCSVALLTGVACGRDQPSGPTAPTISLAGNLAFPNAIVGTPAVASLTISNGGQSPLTVHQITTPPWLTASWSSGIVAPHAIQIVQMSFAPVSPGSYEGTVLVNGDHTDGTNMISVTGSAHPNMVGAWSGLFNTNEAGAATACDERWNMNWTVNAQVGSQFAGTFQATGRSDVSCDGSGRLAGVISPTEVISELRFSVDLGRPPTECTRVSGDGAFAGNLRTSLFATAADSIQCGSHTVHRLHTVAMTKQ